MAVKDRQENLIRELGTAREALSRAEAAVLSETDSSSSEVTVRELTERFKVPEDAVMAFVETVSEVMGSRPLDAGTARRAALVAAAGQAWENELGALLSSSEVRELLGGVSRQRIDELLKARRLIGLRDSGGRRRFPAFQFLDGQPLQSLIAAFWTIADATVDQWTAASWCVSPDQALKGRTPLEWARTGDPGRLQQIARQDAAQLGQ